MSRIPARKIPVHIPESARKFNEKTLPTNKSAETLDQIGKKFLRRRSKSVADLTTLTSKPLASLRIKQPLLEENKRVVDRTKTTQKRPAATNGTGTKSGPVPAKKAKIPSWDYKGRFNQLNEKYTALQDSHNNCEARLAGLRNAEMELVQVRADYERFKKLCEELQNKNQQYLAKNNNLEKECEDLRRQLQESSNQINEMANTIEQHEYLRRMMHNEIQDLKGNIRVFCRVRPPVTQDEEKRLQCSIHFPNESTLEIRKSRESVSTITGKTNDFRQEFNFDKVFAPQATQDEVFLELSQLVQSAVDGYNVCVFAYGQTGSGKTFTMQGTPTNLGMIPKTVDLIFDTIKKIKQHGWQYEVQASFLEIYNENVKDLLQRNNGMHLDIKYNDGKGTTVTNLTTKTVNNSNELKRLMFIANENRAVAATDFNEHSSRSHAVTKIQLNGYHQKKNITYSGSVYLVDLAGSESAKTSSNNRLQETKNINKSLSALGSVMMALYNKDPHVPYRNSKLTFLLQSCLGGNSKTLMIVNISPFEECYNESINSLRFAAQVKEVKIASKRNRILQ